MVCLKSLLLGALALASVGSAADMQKQQRRSVDPARAAAPAAKRAPSYGHQHRRRSFELITGINTTVEYVQDVAVQVSSLVLVGVAWSAPRARLTMRGCFGWQVNTELATGVPVLATVEDLLENVVTKVSPESGILTSA